MHFDVNITIGVRLLFLAAIAVIVMIIDRFQILGGFALLAQTIINANENLKGDIHLAGQFQKLHHHPAFARPTDVCWLPWAFTQKICPVFGVGLAFQQTIEPTDRLGLVAGQQRIHHLNQVPYLWLVKYDVQSSDKCNKFY